MDRIVDRHLSSFEKLLVSIDFMVTSYFGDPEIQRHKVRVLLYPPFYATFSFVEYLRPDYQTTISFFATLFEALAVYNLYICLQSLLAPYYEEASGRKEPWKGKVMGVFKIRIASKWGMHYRVITDILVYQLKGRYCAEVYSVKGAYLWLTVINFGSLSLILTALFTYLAVFNAEYHRGNIPAHGMFWCVKGPIMIIFYVGEILLSILVTAHVIKGTDGSTSHDGTVWSPQAVKFGIYVLLVCFVMVVASILMLKYFGVHSTQHRLLEDTADLDRANKLSVWSAFVDSLLSFIPEFFRNVLCCGLDSLKLARKRAEMRGRRQREQQMGNHDGSNNAMYPVMQDDSSQPLNSSAPTVEPPYNTYAPVPPPNTSYSGYGEEPKIDDDFAYHGYPTAAPPASSYSAYSNDRRGYNNA
ncbi:hypothetical protein Unana1_03208 [Umbelopsis nana]